jgi:predicted restriction endonuclease
MAFLARHVLDAARDEGELVFAAHLIPFNATPDDKPNNGLVLCPSHHRAVKS